VDRRRIEKLVLLGPAALRRYVAARSDTETAWMLKQPREVRESYVREVLEAPETANRPGSLRDR
jgi:hypothetical protein